MGKYSGSYRNGTCCYTIPTADMDDMEAGRCRESEHSHDAYSDSRQLCVVWEFGCEIGMGGLEYLGVIPCYWMSAGMLVGYGYLL